LTANGLQFIHALKPLLPRSAFELSQIGHEFANISFGVLGASRCDEPSKTCCD
jgi:hypothetical protein